MSPRRLLSSLVLAVALTGVVAAPAAAEEKLLTLYSPRIDSLPYVHKVTTVPLAPNGLEAPAEAGYVLGFKEQVLVDSKDPDAKPLPIAKMMVHHLLYFAPGRVDEGPGTCWPGVGFISGRGEEHPDGQFGQWSTKEVRDQVGIHNALASGAAPRWTLTAMVMNHYKKPKSFYVRTRIWYTTEPRTPLLTTVIGNCAQVVNQMAYDVPGGGGPGSTFVDKSTWTVPKGFNGRIFGGASHQHGGALYQTLSSKTCNRQFFKANAYYGADDHPYNTIRPILHEPGPIANGTFRTRQGIPITEGEVLERRAVHDNSIIHVASMGFWAIQMIRDDSVKPCDPMPTDIAEISKPKKYDKTFPFVYNRVVPQLVTPRGPATPFTGTPIGVGDQFFTGAVVKSRIGRPVSWSFIGAEPHSVSVANGPRGFSSLYTGRTRGSYSFTPTVPGTYRLTCLIHPTTMAQTLEVTK
jgi:hypothetical protein